MTPDWDPIAGIASGFGLLILGLGVAGVAYAFLTFRDWFRRRG